MLYQQLDNWASSQNCPFMTELQEASILSAEENGPWQITSPGESLWKLLLDSKWNKYSK